MKTTSFLLLSATLLLTSCDAENAALTSALFDQTAGGSPVVSGPVNMRSGSIRIAGAVSFYDAGGPSGNYSNNTNQVLTVYPDRSGERVTFAMDFFSVEFSDGCTFDVLEIFNGTSTSAPRLDFWCGDGSSFWIPHYFVANNSSGALTFRFKSDGSQTGPGWSGTLYTLTSSSAYSVAFPRAEGRPGNSSLIKYTVFGPSQLPTDQGFCISTTNTAPSRTNGATCYTASTNTYGSRVFTIDGLAVNQTHYMRAFVTPPGGSSIYTTATTYVPMSKELPSESADPGSDRLIPLRLEH